MILYPLAGLKIPGGFLEDGFDFSIEDHPIDFHTSATILV